MPPIVVIFSMPIFHIWKNDRVDYIIQYDIESQIVFGKRASHLYGMLSFVAAVLQRMRKMIVLARQQTEFEAICGLTEKNQISHILG